jgi:hypothetical protein
VPKNNKGNRRSNNNNPEGYNQFGSSWMDSARERPAAAAGLAAAAVGASVFLWSRRSQISEQLNNISDQIGEWNENRRGSDEYEMAGSESSSGISSGSNSGDQFGGGEMAGSGASSSMGAGMSGGSGIGSTPGATGSASGGASSGAGNAGKGRSGS